MRSHFILKRLFTDAGTTTVLLLMPSIRNFIIVISSSSFVRYISCYFCQCAVLGDRTMVRSWTFHTFAVQTWSATGYLMPLVVRVVIFAIVFITATTASDVIEYTIYMMLLSSTASRPY